MTTRYGSFQEAHSGLTKAFIERSHRIHTEKWQGLDITLHPDMVSYELMFESLRIDLGGRMDLDHWREDIQPNLPWADDHFEERVSGVPLNPGVEWANWPWGSSADKHRTEGEMFNHTYAERLWPRFANQVGPLKTKNDFARGYKADVKAHRGIRGEYGDLRTLVNKLAREQSSRQIYIPLYFPEDTGLDGRQPCTLGYLFLCRGGKLHVWYPMRSCDFVRHWRDDCYLAVRLALWVIQECRNINPRDWDDVVLGEYEMFHSSLHIFINDARQMGVV